LLQVFDKKYAKNWMIVPKFRIKLDVQNAYSVPCRN